MRRPASALCRPPAPSCPGGPLRPLAALLLVLTLCLSPALSEEALYIENSFNYVDGAMDVSHGIPQDALGRLGRIRDAGRLTVATEPYFPPQEYIDSSKEGQAQYVGADMELARLIARRMGVELVIMPMAFSEVLASVAEGRVDLAVSALSFTPGRAATLEMSRGYYFTGEALPSGILIRAADAGRIGGAGDLSGCDIAAQSGSVQEAMAVDSVLRYHQFRRLPTVNEVCQAVADGTVDAGIVDTESAELYIARHPDCGLTVLPDTALSLPAEYAGDRVAAPKGEIQLIYFVNGVIDEVLAEGLYTRWLETWPGPGAD